MVSFFWVCLVVESSFFLDLMNSGSFYKRSPTHNSISFLFLHNRGIDEGLSNVHSPPPKFLSESINQQTPLLWGYESKEMHPEMIPEAHLLGLMYAHEGLWLLRIS